MAHFGVTLIMDIPLHIVARWALHHYKMLRHLTDGESQPWQAWPTQDFTVHKIYVSTKNNSHGGNPNHSFGFPNRKVHTYCVIYLVIPTGKPADAVVKAILGGRQRRAKAGYLF